MKKNVIKVLAEKKALTVLIIVCVIMSFVSPYFLTWGNISNLLVQCSINGIMALGMTFAIIGGEFDLSIGAIMALSGISCIMLQPYLPLPLILLIVLLLGSAIGFFNGFLIAHQGANAFIITIGASVVYKGIALTVSGGQPVMGSNLNFSKISNGDLFGIPYVVLIFAACFLIAAWILSSTSFGRNVYAVGGDKEVAAYTGIKVRFYKWSLFAITGFTAALGGILLASKLNTGSAIHGDMTPMQVISAVVVGGNALSGGEGGAFSALIGILIFGVLDNALSLLNVYSYYQLGIKGILIVLIVGTGCYAATHEKKRKLI